MEAIMGITPILELSELDDYQVAQMLVLAGQTQQLPRFQPLSLNPVPPPTVGLASIFGLGDMVYIATSGFRPDVSVLDLAVRKDIPYYQRMSYSNAVEIYSGAPSYRSEERRVGKECRS